MSQFVTDEELDESLNCDIWSEEFVTRLVASVRDRNRLERELKETIDNHIDEAFRLLKQRDKLEIEIENLKNNK
jgi:hypothetical protein